MSHLLQLAAAAADTHRVMLFRALLLAVATALVPVEALPQSTPSRLRSVPVVGTPQVAPTPATATLPHPARSTRGTPALTPQRYAALRVDGGQWPCLAKLWQPEGGWHHAAHNPTSGAYGIPQALPVHKMASAGSDWRTNPFTQVRWGIAYIRDRYETPRAALRHIDGRGWH